MRPTKETARRALRTFLQAFLGVFAANITYLSSISFDVGTKEIVISVCTQILAPALSAGLAALMNLEDENAN